MSSIEFMIMLMMIPVIVVIGFIIAFFVIIGFIKLMNFVFPNERN